MQSPPLALNSPRLEGLLKSELLLAVIMFLVGSALFFRVDKIPGDLGDARFNMYVLEHGYRWLMHLDKSFWSAPFFYPAHNVITYSDNHLGSFLFYSLFRILGAGRETAFQLWAITIFALNYFITWFVLRRQQFHPIAAIGGAYLFNFGLTMATQIGHIQLAPRFMVPIAFWIALRLLETGLPKYLHLLLAACAYQIYLGIYIGYFLILSLIPFCLALFLIRRQWTAVSSFIGHAGGAVILRRCIEYGVSCIAFVLTLLPLALPYYQTQQLVGHRVWEEVATMLPRWQAYLYGPDSLIWGRFTEGSGATLPMRGEHELFPGLLPYLAVIAFFCFWFRKKIDHQQSQVGFAMISVLLVLVVLISYWSGFSTYYFVWKWFPGAGGIRSVTRVTQVLLYPLVFIFAVVSSSFLKSQMRIGANPKIALLGLAILALTVIDQAAVNRSVSKRECKRRMAKMEAAMLHAKGNRSEGNVFWVNQNNADPFYVTHLDAMLAGQALGVNVVNGYSGLLPKGYSVAMELLNGDYCNDLRVWVGTHPGKITNNSLVQIGPACRLYDHECMPVPVKGFSAVEAGNIIHVWAIDRYAELKVPAGPTNLNQQILSFDLTTLNRRSIEVSTSHDYQQTVRLVPGQVQHVELPIPSGDGGVIKFETDSEGVKPSNGDPRTLFFDVENVNLKPASP
jgi:hypothetical protein